MAAVRAVVDHRDHVDGGSDDDGLRSGSATT
jgi:hypothetical protein